MAPNGSLTSIDLGLAEELKDKEFRDVFFEEISRHETAEQIRELRLLRNKTQAELADMCDMQQPAVSRLEKPDYGKWNFQTLMRLAKALDGRVRLQITPSEEALKEFEEGEREDSDSLATARKQALENAQRETTTTILNALEATASQQSIAGKISSADKWPLGRTGGFPTRLG